MTADVSTTPTGALDIDVRGTLAAGRRRDLGLRSRQRPPVRHLQWRPAGGRPQRIPAAPVLITTINFTTLWASPPPTSPASPSKSGIVAVALPTPNKTQPGQVVLPQRRDHGALLGSVQVGALPDMLTFTPDGSKILVANEGEVARATASPATTARARSASSISAAASQRPPCRPRASPPSTARRTPLRAEGVRIFAGQSVSQDVEPEYIAISPDGTKAMVTLQEANAVAILDLARPPSPTSCRSA